MPGTESTLRDAIARARQLGISGSVLDKALAGFQGIDPDRAGPRPRDASNPFGDIFGKLAGAAGETLKSAGGALFSGESLLNFLTDPIAQATGIELGTEAFDLLRSVPKVGGPAAALLDLIASPATLVPAAAPAKFLGAAARIPKVGGLVKGLLEPVIGAPTFIGRLTGEAAAGIGAEVAGTFVADRLPEDMPFPMQIGIMLGAGLAGAVTGVAGLQGLRALRSVNPDMIAVARSGDIRFDPAVEPRVEPSALRNLEPSTGFSALAAGARDIRSDMLDSAARGGEPTTLRVTPELESNYDTFYSRLATFRKANVTKKLVSDRLMKLPAPVKARFGALSRFFDGNAGRSPAGRTIAVGWGNYAASEKSNIHSFSLALRQELNTLFGDLFEQVSPIAALDPKIPRISAQGQQVLAKETLDAKRMRLSRLQRQWKIQGPEANGVGGIEDHNALGSMLLENRDLFNLTEGQANFLEDLDEMFNNDVLLTRMFGVEIDPIDGFYARHTVDLIDEAGKDIKGDQIWNRFARMLGDRRGFQMPRRFQNMLDLQEAAQTTTNPEQWAKQMEQAIKAAGDDAIEVGRLEALRDSGVRFRPRRTNFEDAVAGRLTESSVARAESASLKEANKHGPVVAAEVRRRMESYQIGSALNLAAKLASVPRSIILRLDASMVGVQAMGRLVMGHGLKFGVDQYSNSLLRTIATDDGFLKWTATNADAIALAELEGGLSLSAQQINLAQAEFVSDVITKPIIVRTKDVFDPVTGDVVTVAGKKAKTPGVNINLPGRAVRYLDKIQFERGLVMMKLDTYNYYVDLVQKSGSDPALRALVNGHPSLAAHLKRNPDLDLDMTKREIGQFVNDLFGGRNRIDMGRSQKHEIIETLFGLTPGWTRSTLSLVTAVGKDGARGALARDFGLRGIIIGGALVTLLTVATNGIVNQELVLPNVTDPFRNDWMDVPVPGGRTIRPMARFRSIGKLAFNAINDVYTKGPVEGAHLFTEDALRWASYRQSALISNMAGDPIGELGAQLPGPLKLDTGNRFARNTSVLDLAFDPSTDRGADIMDLIFANAPVSVQNLWEIAVENDGMSPAIAADMALAVGSELLGVGTFGPTMLERQVAGLAGDAALEAGMDSELVELERRRGRPAFNAKDPSGRFIFTSEQRNVMAEQIAAQMGLPVEIVKRGGRRTEREKASAIIARETQQLDTYFGGLDAVKSEYLQGDPDTGRPGIEQLAAAVDDGRLTPKQFSEILSDLRIRRSGAITHLQAQSPAAIAFLQSEKHRDRQNSVDALMSTISGLAYEGDFYDPNTLSFNFEAQAQLWDRLSAVYGLDFDKWLQIKDERKHPLERERDDAFNRMSAYFDIADDIWLQSTGGVLGNSERAFDRQLRQMLAQQGVDTATMTLIIRQIKMNIPAITDASRITQEVREVMRLLDTQLEADVTKWLGNVPILAPGR